MSQERTLGDVASRVLLENERVRIWLMDLAPGESSDVHEHTLDYIEADVFPGNAIYVEKGGIETAKNVGQQRYHEILIELK
jgi:hypothetical protein